MAASGSRAVAQEVISDDSESSDSESDTESEDSSADESLEGERPASLGLPTKQTVRPSPLDDALRIWSFA